ncbi:MAG: hypothetical protein ACLS3M_06415 [Collinsella sp.]
MLLENFDSPPAAPPPYVRLGGYVGARQVDVSEESDELGGSSEAQPP